MPRLFQRHSLQCSWNATRNAALGLALLASLLASLLAAPAQAQLTTFDFSGQPLGTTIPFSETRNGITATFTSPFGPGALTVETSPYSFLSGNVLGDTSPNGAELDVTFSRPLTELGYNFASIASPGSYLKASHPPAADSYPKKLLGSFSL